MKQICQQSRAVWALPVQLRAIQLVVHVLLLVLFANVATPVVSGADRIILRNLKIISNKTVTSFNEDGIRLSDGQMLGWHDIERAKVAEDKQAAFDKMLGELGNHLYRIRQRMVVGDYEGLVSHAEAVHNRYVGRTSDTAYTVMQALMWGKLAVGQREAALAPYLRCYNILRSRGKLRLPIPGERRLVFDARTAITRDIAPIWFDAAAAKAELSNVFAVIREMKARPDGVYIYCASLASAAGEDDMAVKVLGAVNAEATSIKELRTIVRAQREVINNNPSTLAVKTLQSEFAEFSTENIPLALYWLGRDQLASGDTSVQQQGLLDLLRVPAVYGELRPEVAGSALALAIKRLADAKDVRGSIALRGELLAKYGGTFAAKNLNQPSKAVSQP